MLNKMEEGLDGKVRYPYQTKYCSLFKFKNKDLHSGIK